ncbi:MAG: putative transaldolase [candidate division WS6 bacterium OLB20]|uniref:Putative transaldolase n=1 Tax=candidate division WS6 bacterium OLB20 TaxID=1617426 RepID=A0A136LW66_9BACT|nr:MAG: putative transaldolase [candidate division WS6 bacterium OLB20]
MKIFIDTADPEEIRKYHDLGIIDGVTTNPTLATKVGRPYKEIVQEILAMVDGPVSLEVLGTAYDDIMREAHGLAALHKNVVVKVPMIPDGIKAVSHLSKEGIKTNVTLVFSPTQALLAAKVGATYVSPFVGRVDDISADGMELIAEIREIFDNGGYETNILSASDRTPRHVALAAMYGADVATVKPENIGKMFRHPLTDIGLEQFIKDFMESGQEALV